MFANLFLGFWHSFTLRPALVVVVGGGGCFSEINFAPQRRTPPPYPRTHTLDIHLPLLSRTWLLQDRGWWPLYPKPYSSSTRSLIS